MKTRWLLVALCFGAAAIFIYGVSDIIRLRFARGDVYPPYSSLRNDPLGAKIFFESLDHAGADVARQERTLDHLPRDGQGTLFYLGARPWLWRERDVIALEEFVKKGGRLVIAFFPQKSIEVREEMGKKTKNSTATPTPTPTPDEEEKFLLARDLAKRWHVAFESKKDGVGATAKAFLPELDREISWHSALHFGGSGKEWRWIYFIDDRPVVIERALDRGTIVLVADSFLFSNEAMLDERHPATLAWFAGTANKILFDETHLGVLENPGVASLIRRHGLGGLFAGLALIAVLLAWKNAARLIPPSPQNRESEIAVVGKDTFDGLVNLLRRNIPRRDLLETCFREWKNAAPGKEKLTRAEIVIAEYTRNNDLVRNYDALCSAINKKWKR